MDESKNKIKKNALERLRIQQAKIQARIQLMEARQKTSERKNDTRRKILVGSYYLDLAKEQSTLDEINKLMDDYLTRNTDRRLFGLPDLMSTEKADKWGKEKKQND